MPIIDPDWVPPIEMTFDIEKPIRSQQGLMMAGNPIAMAAGKPGAPRVQADAMQGSVAGDTLLFGTGGVGRVFDSPVGGSIEIPQATFRAFTTCEVRFYFELATSTGGVTATGTVRKNGISVLTQTRTLTSFAPYTVDISLVAGDMVEFEMAGTGGGFAVVRNIQYRTGATRTCGGV